MPNSFDHCRNGATWLKVNCYGLFPRQQQGNRKQALRPLNPFLVCLRAPLKSINCSEQQTPPRHPPSHRQPWKETEHRWIKSNEAKNFRPRTLRHFPNNRYCSGLGSQVHRTCSYPQNKSKSSSPSSASPESPPPKSPQSTTPNTTNGETSGLALDYYLIISNLNYPCL